MIVMKFGGTSVGSPEMIERTGELVARASDRDPLVVVSALSGVTDMLHACARDALAGVDGALEAHQQVVERHARVCEALELDPQLVSPELDELSQLLRGIALIGELTERTFDLVRSFGERMSSRIVAAHLNTRGVSAERVEAPDAGLLTDDRFGRAQPLPDTPRHIATWWQQRSGGIPIVTGYIGREPGGRYTTLGRGGSDFSAAVFGAALDAEAIEIWTDVDGICAADPRIVDEARVLPRVSFAEASELAIYGARVIHPATMLPAMERDIPVVVRNTFNPDAPGTRITATGEASPEVVKSIAMKDGIQLLHMETTRMLGQPGFLAHMGRVLFDHEVDVDMIATSEVSVSCTVDGAVDLAPVAAALQEISQVRIERERAIVCVVGEGMADSVGVAGKAFSALGGAGIPIRMISQGASQINLGLVVDGSDAREAVRALYRAFFDAG